MAALPGLTRLSLYSIGTPPKYLFTAMFTSTSASYIHPPPTQLTHPHPMGALLNSVKTLHA